MHTVHFLCFLGHLHPSIHTVSQPPPPVCSTSATCVNSTGSHHMPSHRVDQDKLIDSPERSGKTPTLDILLCVSFKILNQRINPMEMVDWKVGSFPLCVGNWPFRLLKTHCSGRWGIADDLNVPNASMPGTPRWTPARPGVSCPEQRISLGAAIFCGWNPYLSQNWL